MAQIAQVEAWNSLVEHAFGIEDFAVANEVKAVGRHGLSLPSLNFSIRN
jgi:hypothetical protein